MNARLLASLGAVVGLATLVGCTSEVPSSAVPTDPDSVGTVSQPLLFDWCGGQRKITDTTVGCTFTATGPTAPREEMPSTYGGVDSSPLPSDEASAEGSDAPTEFVGIIREPVKTATVTKYNYEFTGDYVESGAHGREQIVCTYTYRGCAWQSATMGPVLDDVTCMPGKFAAGTCQMPLTPPTAPTAVVAYDLVPGQTINPSDPNSFIDLINQYCGTPTFNDPNWLNVVWPSLVNQCLDSSYSAPTSTQCCVEIPSRLPMPTEIVEQEAHG